ncbi:histocompatibility antigen 60b-like [Mastomys coucha]|uniref:histocompatibility antigen 60b-like n=1 Tax=Mastomys coucha TaxID=35658 RepID=UPI001262878C|nr:histocompatibility antigen 60b-like [Mastomys coucha]
MVKGATSKSNHSLNRSLLLLLSYLGKTLADGTDSLSCNITVEYRTLRGQCSVNGELLLHFGGEKHKRNATKLCPHLSQSLRDISEGMWDLQSGNGTLHVTIKSQYDQGKFIEGCLTISTDEHNCLNYYQLNMSQGRIHSNASGAMEEWKNNKKLEQGLRNALMGDFSRCLKKLLPHSREMPKTTLRIYLTFPMTSEEAT